MSRHRQRPVGTFFDTPDQTGKPPSAVLYARVSSKEQELGYSISAQQDLLRRHARETGLVVEREFMDVETAKAAGRRGFNEMVSYFQQHPDCRVLLVEKTDRLSRNLRDLATIEELDLDVHFVKENEIINRESRSSQKFMHGIKVLMAKNYIDNLAEEVKKGLRTKAAQNLWPSFAPLGYVNTVGPDGKRIIIPDPVLGPIVTKLFEWFATGEYSLKALAKKAYEEGFRFRKSQGRVPVTTLHKVLRKRIYTGDFDYGGTTYEGSHEPLVQLDMWEQVQAILDGRHEKRHRKSTHDFAYSGLIECGHCGCSLVGERKKGRYVYYHCTGYRGKCAEPYTREETLTQQFATRLRELVVPQPVLEWLQSEIVRTDQTERAALEQAVRRQQSELERLQARLDLIYEDRLDGRIDTATYDQKAGTLREQLDCLRRKVRAGEAAELPPLCEAIDLVALTSKTADLFLEQPGTEQRKLLRLLLEKASWKGGELRMSLYEPFEKLRLSNSVSPTNCKELREKIFDSDNWRRGGDSNPR